MHACENTTINLTKAHVNQIALKVHATEVLCDDMFIRIFFDNMHVKKVSFNNKPDDDDEDAVCVHVKTQQST